MGEEFFRDNFDLTDDQITSLVNDGFYIDENYHRIGWDDIIEDFYDVDEYEKNEWGIPEKEWYDSISKLAKDLGLTDENNDFYTDAKGHRYIYDSGKFIKIDNVVTKNL